MRAPTTTIEPPAEQTPASQTVETHWWRARPIAAFAVRAAIFVVPILASIAASWLVARNWPKPPGFWPGLGWWVALVAVSGAVMFAVDRVGRRFLPLSTLLRMTLVFPDEKPSRFGVALRTGTTHQLREQLDAVHEHGLVGNEREAAEQLLQLVAALRIHDRFTRGHGERVRAYSALIGEELGLDEVELSKLQWAGLIHDIGKLAVPDEILNKPGRLTDEEFDVIKTHPAEGMRLVGPLAPWLGEWVLAVGEHHERWDGTGYPNQLAGTEISRAGRIVAVADVFDVITAARSYKSPRSAHEAREELARHAGSQFDPEMVRAFLNVSIGRLRTVMWPLSWLANVPYLGTAVTAPAASVVAPALVAVSSALTGGAIADEPAPPPPERPVVSPVDDQADAGDGGLGGDGTERIPVVFPGFVGETTTTTTTSTTPSGTPATPSTTTTTSTPGSTAVGGSTTVPVVEPLVGDRVVVGLPPGQTTTTTQPITVVTPPPTTSPVITGTTLPPLPTTTLPPLPTTLPPLPSTTLPPLPPTTITLPPLDPCQELQGGATELAGADLSGCDLSGLDLTGVDLSGANLTGAVLSGASFRDVDLSNAVLTLALVDGASFVDTNMTGVVAPDLEWDSVEFVRVDLTGAQLTDGDVQDATLNDVTLVGAHLVSATFQGNAYTAVDFTGATMVEAVLQDEALDSITLEGADLTNADLQGADLRGARLVGTNLRRADLQEADLRNAVLDDAILARADLSGADFTGATGRPASTVLAVFDLTICPNGLPSLTTCWP